MSHLTDPYFLVTGVIYLACVAALLTALHRGWFSRFRRGHFWTLFSGIALVGVGSTFVVSIWGNSAAERLLHRQIVAQLEIVGRVVEQQMEREVIASITQLTHLSGTLASGIERRDTAWLGNVLSQMQKTNPQYLQMRVLDTRMSVLAEFSPSGVADPVNKLAAGMALEGRTFASNPEYREAFKKYVLRIDVPVRSKGDAVVGVLGVRYDVQDALQTLTSSARFNENGYAVVVEEHGRVIAHPDPRRLLDDISDYPAVRAALRGESGIVTARNKQGTLRLFFYRPLKSPATVDSRPLALLTEIDEGDVSALLNALRVRFLVAGVIVILVGLILTRLLADSIHRPVLRLMSAAKKVEEGDLTVEVEVAGVDELGRFSEALNAMVRGLRERETIKQVFGQYVASQVSEKVLKGGVNLAGESRRVTILFSDVRDFTAMSEKMTPHEVVHFLNDYFSEMVDVVFENHGMLDKFIGDGLMAVFGAIDEVSDHARQAVRTGLRMKALVAKINGTREIVGLPPIRIGIGVHTDEVVLGNIGSRKRLQYTAIGDGVNICSRIESLNKELGTTLLVTEATYEMVKEAFECRPVREATIRGKSVPVRCYEVLSERSPG